MSRVKLSFFTGGYCTHPEHMVLRGGRKETIRFPAMFALIEHSHYGFILYDTGYSEHFREETASFPYSLYARATPVFLETHETAREQLQQQGIAPEDIRYIIISHFHGDHVSALKDFPHARFIFMRHGYEKIKHLNGIRAVKNGVLPGLLPKDFEKRMAPIDIIDEGYRTASLPHFEYVYDYFGDGSIRLILLDGHFSGQLGALIQAESGDYFLVADACWLSRNYQEYIMPHPLAMMIMNDRKQYQQDLRHIHQFHKENPDTIIVPSHCTQVLKSLTKSQ